MYFSQYVTKVFTFTWAPKVAEIYLRVHVRVILTTCCIFAGAGMRGGKLRSSSPAQLC